MNNIETIKSEIVTRKGLARSNKFSIEILDGVGTLSKSIDLLCESVSLPGMQILTTEYSNIRHATKYPTGIMYEDVELTFLLTQDYYTKKFFDTWMSKIIETNADEYYLKYRKSYCRDVVINQLNDRNEKVYSHKLLDAYPISAQTIELNSTTDDEVAKFNVTLTYDKYEIINHI
jgi:hypothetical protein